jgi:hypothetical protein
MKEFLYQIFSNPFLKPISQTISQIQYKEIVKPNTKRQNQNRFHFGFHFVFTSTFPFFSPVGMRIFL